MEDLKDIQGLDQITAWPLAIGWWMVLSVILGLLIFSAWRLYKIFVYRRSWQYQAFISLQNIEHDFKQDDHKIALQKLAIELRYIAMQYSARESCAGLIGEPWLAWLQEHDPHGFPWLTQGSLLINAQYMPEIITTYSANIYNLIQAAKGWVKKC